MNKISQFLRFSFPLASALFLFDLPLSAVPYQGSPNYYLNCGSTNSFADSQGHLWSADAAYSSAPGGTGYGYVIPGNISRVASDIVGTNNDELYQTHRWGSRLEYRFDLPLATAGVNAGMTYTVKLKFSETFWTAANQRKFRVFLNDLDWTNRGYRVMENADVWSLAGGQNRPYDFVFNNLSVNDGVLKITLNSDYAGGTDNAFIAAIEIQQVPYVVGDIGMSDNVFLDSVERKAFQWFYDSASPPYYLVDAWGENDRPADPVPEANIASVGFQLVTYCIGVHRGWMTYDEAVTRVKGILTAMKLMKKGDAPFDNPYETYYHYYERANPENPMPQLDPVRSIYDNGDLMMGVVFVAEYFRGTEIELMARQLFESLDWNKYGDYTVPTYSEEMFAVLLGASSPRASCRNNSMIAGFNNVSAADLHTPLYFYQWFNLFFDGRNTRPPSGRNDFDYARNATLTNRQDSINLWHSNPAEYNTYDWDSWAMTAATRSHAYNWSHYGGDVNPFAVAASMPFAPVEVLNSMKHMYYRFFKNGFPEYVGAIWSDYYGFCQTYNIGSTEGGAPFYRASGNSGFEMGPIAMGIQNYRDGFVWKHAMNSDYIKAGLYRIGMTGYTVPPALNIAEYKPFTASSSVGANTGNKVFDDDLITRWESAASDPQWIYADLGMQYNIGAVELMWEAAYATQYTIDVSNDANNWVTIKTVTGGDGAVDRFTFTPTQRGRYVRMRGTSRVNSDWGYSLWGFRVYGSTQVFEAGMIDDFEAGCQSTNLLGGSINTQTMYGGTIFENCESDPSRVYSGVRGRWISYNVTAPRQQARWQTGLSHYDARNFNCVSIQVKGLNGGEKFKIGLVDQQGHVDLRSVSDYLPSGISNSSFQQVIIPLSHFNGLNLADLNYLELFFDYDLGLPGNSNIYFDEIRFLNLSAIDDVKPSGIFNLTASPGGQYGEVQLNWMAPGDDMMSGQAARYIVKVATYNITSDDIFGGAPTYVQNWQPLTSGAQEIRILGNLVTGFNYYFSIKAQDEANNTATLSNTAGNSSYPKGSGKVIKSVIIPVDALVVP